MTPQERERGFRELARDLDKRDLAVYAEYGVDPLTPTMGEGDPDCSLAIFGRDPGRHEILHRRPFVGVGGQKVRTGLYRAVHGSEMPDFAASLEIGERAFWANTVPYKPLGNKAWSMKVKKAFAPLVADLLVHGWNGTDVICLGQVAFLWFGIGDRGRTKTLKEHWGRPDRFDTGIEMPLTAPDGASRTLTLYPLPHPSPLNATWAPKFPGLLAGRLEKLGWPNQA